MAAFLRTIRKNKWIRNPALSWLAENEVQADALGDLESSDNTLSLYEVDGDENVGHMRIAIALASNRHSLANVDYALIDSDFLDEISVSKRRVLGTTADEKVNAAHWDLEQLTAAKLIQIADHINCTQRVFRVQQAIIKEGLIQSVKEKTIDYSKIQIKNKDFLSQDLPTSQ